MNTLLNLLGLGVLNGGTNYLAENMWDKQINSLVRDQQEIGRFSSDLNAAKKSALNTALGLYPDLESAKKDPTIQLFLSSIGNKAGPTKYKSDFASSAISGASNGLRQANHYGLFKLKKKPTATAEITPETTTATINPFLPDRWLTTEQRQLINKYSTKKNIVEDNNYTPNYTSSFLGTEQKLNDYNNNYYHPTFNALNYMLNSHNSLYK